MLFIRRFATICEASRLPNHFLLACVDCVAANIFRLLENTSELSELMSLKGDALIALNIPLFVSLMIGGNAAIIYMYCYKNTYIDLINLHNNRISFGITGHFCTKITHMRRLCSSNCHQGNIRPITFIAAIL